MNSPSNISTTAGTTRRRVEIIPLDPKKPCFRTGNCGGADFPVRFKIVPDNGGLTGAIVQHVQIEGSFRTCDPQCAETPITPIDYYELWRVDKNRIRPKNQYGDLGTYNDNFCGLDRPDTCGQYSIVAEIAFINRYDPAFVGQRGVWHHGVNPKRIPKKAKPCSPELAKLGIPPWGILDNIPDGTIATPNGWNDPDLIKTTHSMYVSGNCCERNCPQPNVCPPPFISCIPGAPKKKG